MDETIGGIMHTQYADIAEEYKKVLGERVYRKYSLIESYLKVLGDIKGKSVLDVGCGSGFFTRLIREKGAVNVIGTDVEKKMIEL
ncbi:MAG: methyltransferase domain-containing protein, partial [Candidatus Aenigmarchaeota archaeon]|nr:methyltransferase domain-containing protein [Candidatus Aenigmarchaeota archaeon]